MKTNDLDWPPSFTLDQEKVLNLLTGDRFYSDPSAALREAVLNAIDAVHRRRQTSPNLSPQISLTLNIDDQTLTVTDNGVGMDDEDISRLFAKVGASAATEDLNKESVGEFGIGVISYFMAGDSFQVHTCNSEDSAIGLEFSKAMLAGGKAREIIATRNSQGTTIRIRVRDNKTLDLLRERFAHWCRDVEGLDACVMPSGEKLRQHGSDETDEVTVPDLAQWVERTHLRPVSHPTGWDAMTGNSSVAVLYPSLPTSLRHRLPLELV